MESETIRKLPKPNAASEGDAIEDAEVTTWWARYSRSMSQGGVSPTAMQVIDRDAEYIVNNGIVPLASDRGVESRWSGSRLRRGLAMGSVQSGKTASMLAVVAKALDKEIDLVVILGGTRLALWRQTYVRVIQQLDNWSPEIDDARRRDRVLLPNPRLMADGSDLPNLEDLYFHGPSLARRMLLDRKPLIAIVMKQSDHLMQFACFLSGVVERTLQRTDRRLQLLVIDDESDDGSILDREVELAGGGDYEALKHIPRHIARLWAVNNPPHQTAHAQLYATYLAYTATPQSNFLQSDHNPLSPSDFVVALRSPLDEGSVDPPRSPTFSEPLGLASYYTGGEMFYRRFAGEPAPLCITRPFPSSTSAEHKDRISETQARQRDELLSDALRAYFVSGALRLLASGKLLSAALCAKAASATEIKAACPGPHTMLFHPSARVEEHFAGADQVASWCLEFLPEAEQAARRSAADTPLRLDPVGLSTRLEAEEPLWKEWIDRFAASFLRTSFLPGGASPSQGGAFDWAAVKEMLVKEVFPNTRLTVINSDPRADDRPEFEPRLQSDAQYACPLDIYTIFVSGNVMARGLTLEGLCTTLFLRAATEPLADTQMQMQRWFGYRGKYLPWCRVFMFDDQLELFRSYHEADEALRREIIGEMNCGGDEPPGPMVLQGFNFRATGKIANLRALPLCPGADPFVRVVEGGAFASHNAQVVNSLLVSEQWVDVQAAGRLRGVGMVRQLSLLEAADILDMLRYTHHAPDPRTEVHRRWRAIELELGLNHPEAPLFRPPSVVAFEESVTPTSCPYSIAAYLRLWNAMLVRRGRGFYPTDNPRVPWAMIDLNDYARAAPKFFVGVRFGPLESSTHRFADIRVSAMIRENDGKVLRSTWGSRNPGEGFDRYLGDQLFDYHMHGGVPPKSTPGEPLWRPRGAPGLLLFHIFRVEGAEDAVAVGLALPKGGPDHIAALRANGSP